MKSSDKKWSTGGRSSNHSCMLARTPRTVWKGKKIWHQKMRPSSEGVKYATGGMKVEVLVTQSCLTLCKPVDYNLPCSSLHGILQARILERVSIPFSRGSSWLRDWTQVSHIVGIFFTIWATREASNEKSFNFSHLCQHLLFFFIIAILMGVKCYLTVVLICSNPMANWASFHVFIGYLHSQILWPFLIE